MSEAKSTKVLVLRTCNKNMSSHHDISFIWPRSGPVEAPEWDPDPSEACGKGLHGLLWGRGDWFHLSEKLDAVWMVVEVDTSDGFVNHPGDKCRFRRGNVVYAGNKAEAVTMILCSPGAMEGCDQVGKGDGSKAASSGHRSTAASGGDKSTAASSGNHSASASSGHRSASASSGHRSASASSGDYSTAASSGDYSASASGGNHSASASSGYGSKAASSGDGSKAASSGDYSIATSGGDRSRAASSGDCSTAASSGDRSKAEQSGKSGIAAAIGDQTKAKAGENGLIIVTYWDEDAGRYRGLIGEVGIEGIEPDTWYIAKDGKLAEG